jgi:hypothetical protein
MCTWGWREEGTYTGKKRVTNTKRAFPVEPKLLAFRLLSKERPRFARHLCGGVSS